MIVKKSDERKHDVATLTGLLGRTDLSGQQRKAVEKTLISLRSGLKGEREAAFHIDFSFKDSENYAIIHDLRIVHEGRVAQIDHLVIGRFLNGFVCETKYWSNGVSINEQGEFTACYGPKRIGVPSPITQNARHIMVLNKAIAAGRVLRPKRLGMKLPIVLSPLTLVSTGAKITRPNGKAGEKFAEVIKADQFFDYTQSYFDANMSARWIGKLVSLDTLRGFAKSIANLHQPITMDYAAKFGIKPPAHVSEVTSPRVKHPKTRPHKAVVSAAPKPRKTYNCATCGDSVELKVARYCWFNKPRFNGEIRCRVHQ